MGVWLRVTGRGGFGQTYPFWQEAASDAREKIRNGICGSDSAHIFGDDIFFLRALASFLTPPPPPLLQHWCLAAGVEPLIQNLQGF